jgi:hypothetical protein
MAREAVKLALIRRDNRRTRQFRIHRFVREAEHVGDKAATYCLIEKAASSIFETHLRHHLEEVAGERPNRAHQ